MPVCTTMAGRSRNITMNQSQFAATSIADWYAEAQRLMAAPKDEWGPADYAQAAAVLSEAAEKTYEYYPFGVTLAIAEAAVAAARVAGSRREEANALKMMGRALSQVGNPLKALPPYEQALPMMRAVGDRIGEATILNEMGQAYRVAGQQHKAWELRFFHQAEQIILEMDDYAQNAEALTQIGNARLDRNNWSAIDYYSQALSIFRERGDKAGEAHMLNNIGVAESDLWGDKEKAFGLFQQAASLFQQIGDKAGEASALDNIGSALAYEPDLNDRPRAMEIYQQALSLWSELGSRWYERFSRNETALMAHYLGRFDEAETQLTAVVVLDETLDHPDLEKDRAALARVQAVRRGQVADIRPEP